MNRRQILASTGAVASLGLAALRAMLLSDHIDGADERVLRSLVAFLEGEADAATL